MKKLLAILCVIVLFPAISWAACTGSSPTWTATPDYASVSSCVSQASDGDTINVSAGSATWTSQLLIQKAIKLIGAGIGNTVITHNAGSNWLINYDAPDLTNVFRFSGFTIDFNNGSGLFIIMAPCGEPTEALVRIDHNRFQDTGSTDGIIYYGGQNTISGCSGSGQVFGVIDSNIFSNINYIMRANADSLSTWNAYPDRMFHDSDQNIWFEDNVIYMPTTTSSPPSYYPQLEGDYGARWGGRYNTFYVDGYHTSFTDNHGGGSGRSTMGAVMYGNYITNSNDDVWHFIHNRGARVITHHNNLINCTENPRVRLSSWACPDSWEYDFNHTYHFQNRIDTTGQLIPDVKAREECAITENSKYWMDNTGADPSTPVCIDCDNITSGIGCGSTLPTNCTPSGDTSKGSTAFWLTDQSCTSLANYTGASTAVTGGNRDPSYVIEGTLYECTATDTWTEYYTPFEYPHPLRDETTTRNIQGITIQKVTIQ